MPNWCEVDISFRSGKKKKLEKIANKMIKNKDTFSDYGNLQTFDTLYNMEDLICQYLEIDSEKFSNIINYLYDNCIYDNSISYHMPLLMEDIVKIFNITEELMEKNDKPKINKPRLIRMHSVIKQPDLVAYRQYGKGVSPYDKLNVTNMPKLDNYWDWSNNNIGVKWDIDYYGDIKTPMELLDSIYFDDTTQRYHLDICGMTPWSIPDKFVEKVCKKYKVYCFIKYYEPGMQYAGSILYNKKGEIIEDYAIDGNDELFTIKAERNMMYGDDGIYNQLYDEYEECILDPECEDHMSSVRKLKYFLDTTDLDKEKIRKDLGWKRLFKNKK